MTALQDLQRVVTSEQFKADVRRWHAQLYPHGCRYMCGQCRERRGELGPRGAVTLRQVVDQTISSALKRHNQNVGAAARELDVSRSTVYRVRAGR